MIIILAAAAALSLHSTHSVNSANAAIHVARQTCWKGRVHLFGQWHATLDGIAWTVWFGKNSKRPLCNDEGAIVAEDGSKTDCLITVC